MSVLEQKRHMALSIQPTGNAGAEVLGVDLSKQISADDLISIKNVCVNMVSYFSRPITK